MERTVDRCESHVIYKQSGLKKRPRKCLSPDIALSIMWRGNKIFLCHNCWTRIAELDIEWGEKNENNKSS